MVTKMTKAELESELKKATQRIAELENQSPATTKQTQAEIYYRALFEQIHDAVFIMDLKGAILTVNQRAADMLGYKKHEMLGLAIEETSTEPEQSNDVVRRLIDGEQIPLYERIFRKKDGSFITAEINIELVSDENGKPFYIQSVVRDITKRKQAENDIKDREAQYRLLADNISDIVWLMDPGLQIIYISPSTTKIQGYTLEELKVLTLEEQMTRESFERAMTAYAEALSPMNLSHSNPKLEFEIDLEFYKKDRTTYWSRNTFKLILDKNHGLVNILGIGRDITSRKLAEEQLIKSEERYRIITEDMPAMVCRFLADGTITFINSFYCNYFNAQYEELIGSNFLLLIPENEREFVRNNYLSLDRKKPFITYEYKAFDADGKDCWQKWTDRALFNEQGELVEYQSIGEDITERKMAEQQLAESESRIRTLISNTGDLIIVIDEWGNITFASPSSEQLFGYKPEESVGRNFAEWIHPDDLAEALEALQSRKQSPGSPAQSIKVRGLHKDGAWRYVEALGTNLLNDPAIRGILINIRDITEQRRAELERQVLYEIMQGLAFSKDLGEFLGLVHYSIGRVLQANNLFVSLYNPSTGFFEDVYSVDQYDEVFEPSSREGTLTSYIFRTGNPLLVTDEKFKELIANEEVKLVGADSKSWIGVPLKTVGKTIGVMAIQDYETANLYSEKDLAFLASISGQVASAMERKLAEERLHESEKRFATAYENAPIGMALVETNGRILKANQAFCKFTGYSENELTSKAFQEITNPDDLDTDLKLLTQLLAGKIQSYQMEKRYLHKLGHYVWGALHVSLVKSNENIPLYLIGQIRDITETKLANETLKESEKRYRSLFEDSPISLWEDDYSAVKQKIDELKRQGVADFEAYFAEHPEIVVECASLIRIIDANQYSITLFNAKNKEELLRNANSFLGANYIDSQELVNIANGITRFEWEGVNKKLSGELMNIKLSWSVAPGHENDLSKVIISIIDISDRKQAESEINRQLSELETLYESGLAISRLLTPKEIAQKVIEILDRKMNWHHIAIRQYEPETNTVKLIAFNRPGVNVDEAEEFITKMNQIISTPNQGLSGWVTLHGKSVRVPNIQEDERYIGVFSEIHSGLYVPIKIGERVTGSISVESEIENAFNESDERLLETLAGQAAIAIENANLFMLTQREIIERQQAENALQAQTEELLELNNELERRVKERTAEIEVTRKRLELAADAAGLGIWEWDISTGNLIWDSQMYKIYDVSPEEFEGNIDTLLKAFHPEDQNILLERAQQIIENKETNFRIEHRIVRKNGDVLSLFEQGVAVFDDHGFLERIIGIVNDVTPQRQAEQDLRESEAYAHLLFDAAPDPVSVAEVDGIMVDVNRLFEQQHQVQRADVRGRHISELNIFPPGQLEKASDYIVAIVAGREVPPVELDFYSPDEGIHTLEMHSYPIEVKGRRLILSTSRDITIHKKAEEALRLSNSEMERALRVKDEFLANMSHELRTPLNAVLGMSESLEEQIAGPLNEKQLRYIRTIRESGKHLLDLINDILDLSKIEAGRLELNVSQVSVSSLCEASLRMVKEQAQKKNQKVSLHIDPAVKIIMGDERRLKQSLVNLLSNAVKFTPNDRQVGVEVIGNVRNQTVTFAVWDEGIGMSPEDLNMIFKPFVQLDAGLAREFSGTGLGLVLVAQMIRLHGGSVSVESKEEQGSRFSFTLPWVDVEGSLLAKEMLQKTEAGSTTEEKRSGKILIVEDTDSIILLLSEYLRYKGYQVIAAHNGMEGVMLASKEKPDLILMDVMMPIMDGVEATKQIRMEKDLKETPIIALTALAMTGDKERCLQAGMNDYLSKPVQMKDLETLIAKHLQKIKKQATPPT